MAKGNGDSGNPGRFSYPRTSSELDSANAKAHRPHKIPSQTEAGADALKAGHRKITDQGMLTRPDTLPGAQSSPLDGSMDCPYESWPLLRK